MVKCPGLVTDVWVLLLGGAERVCGTFGLSLELLECGMGLGGWWLCMQVKQPAPEQQVCVFWVYSSL